MQPINRDSAVLATGATIVVIFAVYFLAFAGGVDPGTQSDFQSFTAHVATRRSSPVDLENQHLEQRAELPGSKSSIDTASAPSPTSAPLVPAEIAPHASLPISEDYIEVPQHLRAAFQLYNQLAEQRGLPVDWKLKMPPRSWALFKSYADKFDADHKTVSDIRYKALERLVDGKVATGRVETFTNPGAEPDPARRARLKEEIARARRPTAPDQTVVSRGNAQTLWLIRVNPAEDPDLATAYLVINRAKDHFVANAHVLMLPFLTNK